MLAATPHRLWSWAWVGAAPTAWSVRLFDLVLAGVAVLTATLTLHSLSWPMAHDAPLMQYVAWLIRGGVVPYREIFDMNLPGTYLLHLLALNLFGPSDFGFRLFDLSVLLLTTIGIVVAGWSFGWRAGLSAGVLFWLYHVAGGAWHTGQRDFLLTPFLAWETVFLFRCRGGVRLSALFWAGFCLGFAVWIKPYALFFFLAVGCLLFAVRQARRIQSILLFSVGALVPTAGILGWLASTGGLNAFFEMVSHYLLSLYARLGGTAIGAIGQLLLWHPYGKAVWVGFALLVGLSLYRGIQARSLDRRHDLLALGVFYGVVHFLVQRKGWEYHLTPLALFASLLGTSELDRIVLRGSRTVRLAGLGLFVLLSAVLGMKGADALEARWYVAKRERAQEVADALRPYLRPTDTIQVMDTTEGGIHALFLLGVRQPTRFLYDFHFYHDVDHPTIQALRSEFVDALRRTPPAFFILFEQTWLHPGYDRVREWPALQGLLDRGYALKWEGSSYRIYAKRTDS